MILARISFMDRKSNLTFQQIYDVRSGLVSTTSKQYIYPDFWSRVKRALNNFTIKNGTQQLQRCNSIVQKVVRCCNPKQL